MAALEVWQSQAWDDWRTAVTPVWNSESRPHMGHTAKSPGVYRRIFRVGARVAYGALTAFTDIAQTPACMERGLHGITSHQC